MTATVADVQAIFDTDLDATKLGAFLTTAQLEVDEKLAGSGMSEARLDEITKYLTAHLASFRDPRMKSEVVEGGRLSRTVQGLTGMGLKATYYGQMVLNLDTSGTFALYDIGNDGEGGVKRVTFLAMGGASSCS